MSRAASKPSPIGPAIQPPLPATSPPGLLPADDEEGPSFAVTLRALLAPPVVEPPARRREPDSWKQEQAPAAKQPVEPALAPPPLTPGPPPVEEPTPVMPAAATTAIVSPEVLAGAGMLRQAQVVTLDGATGLHLELETPRLARVGLDLRLAGGRIEASFVASTADECALLRAGAASLEAALRARGLEVGAVRVALPGEGPESRHQQQQRRRGQAPGGEEPRPPPHRRGFERVL